MKLDIRAQVYRIHKMFWEIIWNVFSLLPSFNCPNCFFKHLHDNCRTFQRSTSLCWTNIMTQHCHQFIGTFFKSCNCSAWRAVLETRNNNKMQFSAWHSYIFFRPMQTHTNKKMTHVVWRAVVRYVRNLFCNFQHK